MHKTGRLLLDNLLNGLDRLFDGDTTVVDIHDLVYATLIALADTEHAPSLCVAETELMSIARSGNSRNQQRETALMVTHELRQYLALSDVGCVETHRISSLVNQLIFVVRRDAPYGTDTTGKTDDL